MRELKSIIAILLSLSFFVTALLLFRVIGPYISHIVSYDTLWIIFWFLVTGIVSVFALISKRINYSSRVTKKPIQSIRAKVMSKEYFGRDDYYSRFCVVFLVDNKIEFRLGVSKKQYKAIKKNDIVDLVYQGVIARSIKKLPDGVVILNEKHPQKK